VSGNPGGRPRIDLAAEIARALFENDGEAIYAAFQKVLRKGSPYAFQVLSDRAFGKLKETHAIEHNPLKSLSNEELDKRIEELKTKLNLVDAPPRYCRRPETSRSPTGRNATDKVSRAGNLPPAKHRRWNRKNRTSTRKSG
jgi:hypothetical protein